MMAMVAMSAVGAMAQILNTPPVALGDDYNTNEDTPLIVETPGVLANDTDLEGNPLTAVLVNNVANGTLVLNADGSFTYTPNANFNGTDSFTYNANDGTTNSLTPATVSITVNAVNDAPTANAQSVTTNEDVAKAITLVGNDVEGNALTYTIVSGPSHGSLSGTGANRTYTPDANYNGPDSFTFKVNDGTADSNVATVSVTVNAVNDAPVADNDSYSVNEDNPLPIAAPGVLDNDSDVDNVKADLKAILVDDVEHGELTLNDNGSFSYTPDDDFFGSDSFTYKANDGGLDSNVVTVSITVRPVNDAPVATDDNGYETDEDEALVIENANTLVANDSAGPGNENDQTLTVTEVSGATHGTVILEGGQITFTPDANYHGPASFDYEICDDGKTGDNLDPKCDTGTVNVTVNSVNDAPVAQDGSLTTDEDTSEEVTLNASDVDGDTLSYTIVSGPAHGTLSDSGGTRTYTPNNNYNGPDSFTFKATDGIADSNVATVSITVNAVNDAPVATPDSATTDEDMAEDINVITNDTDVDNTNAQLSVSSFTQAAHGTVTSNPDGTLKYTPAANYNGSDSFTYKAKDASLDSNSTTVSITINAVNDAPVVKDDSLTTDEDNSKLATLSASDVDNTSSSLTFKVTSLPADGKLYKGNSTDAAGEITSASLNSPITIVGNQVTYKPNLNYSGPDSFRVVANDGSLNSDETTIFITVSAVNDAPAADNDSYSVNEDTTLTVPAAEGLLANDDDVEDDTLHVADGNASEADGISPAGGPSHGSVVLNANGSFTYTPNANYNGSDSFTYRVCDNGSPEPKCSVETATVTITINPVNDAPGAQGDSYSVVEDTVLNIAAPGVLSNDTDLDSANLTAVKVSNPANGQVTLNGNGSFTYTPQANFNGGDSFTYKANDGSLDSNTVTVNITVKPVNDAPSAINGAASMNEDAGSIQADLRTLVSDFETADASLSYTIVSGPTAQQGTLTTTSTSGVYSFEAADNYFGEVVISYEVTDRGDPDNCGATGPACAAAKKSDTKTMTVTVNGVNDAPSISDIANQSAEAGKPTAAIPFTVGDIETPAGDLTLSGSSSNTTLVPNSNITFGVSGENRTLTVTPAANKSGTTMITVRVSDGNAEATDTFVLTVTDTSAPIVIKAKPTGKKVSPRANIVATFSEAMMRSSLNKTTVKLVKKGTTKKVAATLSYPAPNKVVLNPKRKLVRGAIYTVTIAGGASGAKDVAGNALETRKMWKFRVR